MRIRRTRFGISRSVHGRLEIHGFAPELWLWMPAVARCPGAALDIARDVPSAKPIDRGYVGHAGDGTDWLVSDHALPPCVTAAAFAGTGIVAARPSISSVFGAVSGIDRVVSWNAA